MSMIRSSVSKARPLVSKLTAPTITASTGYAARTFSSSSSSSSSSNTSHTQTKIFTAAVVASGLATAWTWQQLQEAEAAGTQETKQAGSPDFAAIRQAIVKLLDEDDNRGPTFVRLAWHASGTYDKHSNTGGSNGSTMRYQPEAGFGANYGLEVSRGLLEPIKREFPSISYADLWTFASVVAIEYMGGPAIAWRPGRTDATTRKACPPNGRLPDADKGTVDGTAQHIRDIFYRMGFDDREIVALAGAHSLGRCHVDRSGYEGPWTRSPTTFSNEYFRELIENKWTPKKWDGPAQFEDPTGELMMLPADIMFIQDAKFKPFVELYAKDQNVFFQDFAKAYKKLIELGVPFPEDKKQGGSWWWWPFGGSK